jgi:hypothetical protein
VAGEESDSRSYVYTYFNGYLEESGPSPASMSLTVKDGDAVTVSGLAAPPSGWDVVGVNIYRTVTGPVQGEQGEHKPNTAYLRVVSLLGQPSSYEDKVLMKNLGVPLHTYDTRVPPSGMKRISHLAGTGVLVGVTEDMVCFSDNLRPWDWPDWGEHTLPYRIVNMVSVDTKVFVSTEGRAYVLDASGYCEPQKIMPVIDTDSELPDVSCGYPSQAVPTPFGMVYPGKAGLVNVKPDASYELLTAPWYSPSDWARLAPESARLAFWQGRIFCVTERVSFVLGIDPVLKDHEGGALTTISDKPVDMRVTATGELLMLEGGKVWQWDAGDTSRPYDWESTVLEFGGELSPTAARVVAKGPATFRITGTSTGLSFERFVGDRRMFRLGRLGRQRGYKVGLTGVASVESLEFGTTAVTMPKEPAND